MPLSSLDSHWLSSQGSGDLSGFQKASTGLKGLRGSGLGRFAISKTLSLGFIGVYGVWQGLFRTVYFKSRSWGFRSKLRACASAACAF